MRNPFRYGAKVTGGSFYDRREIKASMMNVLDGGNNVVLYGPRRYGKSSLVAEMIEELRAGAKIVFAGGLMGTIQEATAKTFKVEIAPGTTIEIDRGCVSGVVTGEESAK